MASGPYILDPGSHFLRLYDPKSQSFLSVRTCLDQSDPPLTGLHAIASCGANPFVRLCYPLRERKLPSQMRWLLKDLVDQIPPAYFLSFKSTRLLCDSDLEPLRLHAWQNAAVQAGLFSLHAFPLPLPPDPRPIVHIHAGASKTIVRCSQDGKCNAMTILPLGGHQADQNIVQTIARENRAMIFEEDACAIKESISQAYSQHRCPSISCSALDQHGKMVKLSLNASRLWPGLESVLVEIAEAAKAFLEESGIVLEGYEIWLSGGFACCFGLKEILQQTLQKEVRLLEDPQNVWLAWSAME